MMPGVISILLDLVVICLLIATIVYAIRLNRQLTAVKESRSELEGLVKGFAEATAQAEAGVKGMRRAASESGELLQSQILKAQDLKEELEIIVQSADGLANRLEAASGKARQAAMSAQSPAPAPVPPAPPARLAPGPSANAAEPRSKAEKELLQALENLRQ
ncbi:DUF6468 domain-containing protein [Indioceanicola profundi]|uniref:DUF6468 domain-containing protein n=1 Tax=Indioceanicola profundi TaxID=2220096 RepID=UPI000E6AC320|nr:DUF6468 domain-containing protein [Indioceanicola profundi]